MIGGKSTKFTSMVPATEAERLFRCIHHAMYSESVCPSADGQTTRLARSVKQFTFATSYVTSSRREPFTEDGYTAFINDMFSIDRQRSSVIDCGRLDRECLDQPFRRP